MADITLESYLGLTKAPKLWVNGKAYVQGEIIQNQNDGFKFYTRLTAGSGVASPESDAANWTRTFPDAVATAATPFYSIKNVLISPTFGNNLKDTTLANAVNQYKTILNVTGAWNNGSSYLVPTVTLLDSTTIRCSAPFAGTAAQSGSINVQMIEYK